MEMEENQAGFVASICGRGGGEGMVLNCSWCFLVFNGQQCANQTQDWFVVVSALMYLLF